jgi:hypothetical protein
MDNVPEILGTVALAAIGCWFLYALVVKWLEFR